MRSPTRISGLMPTRRRVRTRLVSGTWHCLARSAVVTPTMRGAGGAAILEIVLWGLVKFIFTVALSNFWRRLTASDPRFRTHWGFASSSTMLLSAGGPSRLYALLVSLAGLDALLPTGMVEADLLL